MTAGEEERALAIVEAWRTKMFMNECQAKAALQVAIADALHEERRLAREECAEAVSNLRIKGETPTGEDAIDREDAIAACITSGDVNMGMKLKPRNCNENCPGNIGNDYHPNLDGPAEPIGLAMEDYAKGYTNSSHLDRLIKERAGEPPAIDRTGKGGRSA